MPKLFLHGTADPTVPFVMGEQLFAAAAGPKSWFPVAGAGHNDLVRARRHGLFPDVWRDFVGVVSAKREGL